MLEHVRRMLHCVHRPHVLVLPSVTVDGVLSYLHFLAIMSAVDMSVCMSVQVPTCNYRAFFIVVETKSHSAALAILEYTTV